ncbi:unnamed protein product [Polarella glacialis]|uniref:PRA1 family protein n=1 Tax=Polarella glacialis TaxID=89957 RepID=A0A813LPP8_POLGL|nr:unnamed protein product [Polarella glacialis]
MAELSPVTVGAALDAADTLPKGVEGAMDGEKPPMNQLEEFKKAIGPYKERYGHYLTQLKPWRDFIRLSKPEGDIQKRLQVNLTHFQINYAVIFSVQMLAAIVMNPSCLIVMSVLALVWLAFLKKNDDPSWEVSVGGMPLGKTQRWMVLSAITGIVLLCVVGQVFFSAFFFFAMCVLVHGILHPTPELGFGEEVLLFDARALTRMSSPLVAPAVPYGVAPCQMSEFSDLLSMLTKSCGLSASRSDSASVRHRAAVLCVAWAPPTGGRSAPTLASGAADGHVAIWRETRPGSGVWSMVHQMNVPGAVNALAFGAAEPNLVLAVGSGDELGILTLLVRKDILASPVQQAGESWQVKALPAHDGGVADLSWKPVGSPLELATGPAVGRAASSGVGQGASKVRRLVTCGADGRVLVWLGDARGEMWKRERFLDDGPDGVCSAAGLVRSVAWRPNFGLPSSTVAICTEDGLVALWVQDAEGLPWTVQTSWKVQGDARRISWAKAGTFLAVSVQQDGAVLYKESAGGSWLEVASVDETVTSPAPKKSSLEEWE